MTAPCRPTIDASSGAGRIRSRRLHPSRSFSGGHCRENTRAKDLIDLVLLIERTKLDAVRLQKAIHETFWRRKTHNIPSTLSPPPLSWSGPFSEMAAECSLEPGMEKNFGVAAQFFGKLNL